MKGKLLSWIRGSVHIQVIGTSSERFLNLCAYHEITLWNIKTISGGFEANLSASNFRDLKPLARKCHVHLKIIHKNGLPFVFFRYRKRKILLFAVLLAVLFTGLLSNYIWDIDITGNRTVTDERIMDYLRSQNIHQGIKKDTLDYKLLASNLRENFSEITWVSVKLQGTRLIIDLKENRDSAAKNMVPEKAGHLVADADGTIVKMVTRAGTACVSVGMKVKKGDLLVSGIVELVNDAGEIYDQKLVSSDADIFIQTSLDYHDKIPLIQKKKQYTGKKKQRILLQIGKLMIGLPFFKIPYETYDMVVERKQIRVMENFYLPIYFSDLLLKEYQFCQVYIPQAQAEAQLKQNLDIFLKKIEEKGVQIFENNVKIEKTVSTCEMKGKIFVIQKTGQWADIELDQQQEGTLTE